MDKSKNHSLEDTITRYALIIFAILLALIVYTYFTTQSTQQEQVVSKPEQQIQATEHTKKNISKVAFQTETPLTRSSAQNQGKPTAMKLDDYKVPAQKQEQRQKLTDLLPKDLKDNIQASLITEKELKELSPEEQNEYKETQQKLAIILREIGQTEAENQRLQSSLSEVKNQSKQLDIKVKKLRKVDR